MYGEGCPFVRQKGLDSSWENNRIFSDQLFSIWKRKNSNNSFDVNPAQYCKWLYPVTRVIAV